MELERIDSNFFVNGKPLYPPLKTQKNQTVLGICRFCGGTAKPTSNNGVSGPGYAEWNYICKQCGRAQ